ncbi:MAG: hypothetical protein DA408_11895 [Bacteroidetes bacterium]|nr:MAG: hypothetical protein C7N36_20025 [Bacteroidota bacterium]PTM12147.1 MAG: hypothetical protein DA408_11895 [Bacteroidota bacterium]
MKNEFVKKTSIFLLFFLASFGLIYLIKTLMGSSTTLDGDLLDMIVLALIISVNTVFVVPFFVNRQKKQV